MSGMQESWAPHPTFDGYLVSDQGRILGRRGSTLQPHVVKGGYLRVHLRVSGRDQNVLVHRMVAAVFIGPCPAGHEVNHRNGNTADNRVTNLEYKTPSENVIHAYEVLGRSRSSGEKNWCSKLTDSHVRAMREMHAKGISAAQIGRQFGVYPTTAWNVVTRRTWKHLA